MSLLTVNQDIRAQQQCSQRFLNALKSRLSQRLPGDQHDIPAWSNQREVGLNRLPEQAFGSITLHSLTCYTTSDNTDSQSFNLV
jgi:hypothetical protein